MQPMTTTDTVTRRSRGPEEIVLDGWLEDAGPYVKLELQGPRWKGSAKYVEPGRARAYDPNGS
jgi:hypothetical protein